MHCSVEMQIGADSFCVVTLTLTLDLLNPKSIGFVTVSRTTTVKKVKFTVLHKESVGGRSSPSARSRARNCTTNVVTRGQWDASRKITAYCPVPNYTAW